MNKQDVEIGVTFYTVLSLGKRSIMEANTPTSKPYEVRYSDTKHSSIFVNVSRKIDAGTYDTDMSLCDAGIIPNTYNGHESFLSEKAAKHHLNLLLKFAGVFADDEDHP